MFTTQCGVWRWDLYEHRAMYICRSEERLTSSTLVMFFAPSMVGWFVPWRSSKYSYGVGEGVLRSSGQMWRVGLLQLARRSCGGYFGHRTLQRHNTSTILHQRSTLQKLRTVPTTNRLEPTKRYYTATLVHSSYIVSRS